MTKIVSVIIAIKKINDYIRESISHILKQSYKNIEIIVVTDEESSEKFPKTRIFSSGSVHPGDKRDLGVKKARGEIIAFIDDDAYPDKDWIKNALKYLNDEKIGAVGGPGLTPENDSFEQKIGGLILDSWLASGNTIFRTRKDKERFVDDYPSFNFFMRKSLFDKIGGFSFPYWRGEDTKLCLDIIKGGYKIIYLPDVVVHHHRRAVFIPHLKQVWKCALYRGFFAKKYSQTSLRLAYLVPSIFILFLIFGGIFLIFSGPVRIFYFFVLAVYFILLLVNGIKSGSLKAGILVVIGTFLTHLVYGVGVIKGLLGKVK